MPSLPTSRRRSSGASASSGSSAGSGASGGASRSVSAWLPGGVSSKALLNFTRSFSVMLSAQLPLVESLRTAKRQSEDEALIEVLEEVIDDVEGGLSLSRSLAKHDDTFSDLYVHLVRVGEAAGILNEVLMQLAGYLERRDEMRRKIRLALVYPGLILTISLGATLFLLTVIVPTFADLFADFGAELPGPTKAVLGASRFLTGNWMLILGGLAVLVFGVRAAVGTETGRRWKDVLVLKLPLFGSLLLKNRTARFCRTVGTLLDNGVALLEALQIQARAASNVRIEEAVDRMIASVKRGDPLTQPLTDSVFPGMVVQMIRVGEETAELERMMLRAAEHYESEVEDTAETLTSVLEPILIVVIGIILGGILVSMYLPMFDMMNVVQ